MRKPENAFIASVERHLPPQSSLHREKMSNPYRGGTADKWYSGSKGDLWVEYKYMPTQPQKGNIDAKRVGLTQLQIDWLSGRHSEGRSIAVIIGVPKGGVVLLNKEWEHSLSIESFLQRVVTKKGLAEYIEGVTMR